MEKPILEVCVDSLESAMAAVRGGADRLEVCSNLLIGGTSANPFLVRQIKERMQIRIHALIRPRFGDFCYSDSEIQIMTDEILQLCEYGVDGIVTGVLEPSGVLDLSRMQILIDAAGNRPITLHRAFDMCADPIRTLEEAKELGIRTILTSGQQNLAIDGLECIRELVRKSGENLDIMAGSGIDAETIKRIKAQIALPAYHMSGKLEKQGRMQFRNPFVSMGLPIMSEYVIWETEESKVREAVMALGTD